MRFGVPWRRKYCDLCAAQLKIISCLVKNDGNLQRLRFAQKSLQLRTWGIHSQP
jgi:hypothetical protein